MILSGLWFFGRAGPQVFTGWLLIVLGRGPCRLSVGGGFRWSPRPRKPPFVPRPAGYPHHLPKELSLGVLRTYVACRRHLFSSRHVSFQVEPDLKSGSSKRWLKRFFNSTFQIWSDLKGYVLGKNASAFGYLNSTNTDEHGYNGKIFPPYRT